MHPQQYKHCLLIGPEVEPHFTIVYRHSLVKTLHKIQVSYFSINVTYTRQCSNALSFGITRLRLLREQIENRLYIKYHTSTVGI